MKLNLTKVYRTDTDKAGNKLKTKDGREYTRTSVKCAEYGDKWISGFSAPWNTDWKEGQEVEAEVKKNGEYLNFEKSNPMTELNKAIMRHESEIGKLWAAIKALQEFDPSGRSEPEEVPTVTEEDLINMGL